jgi:hypothetical protein
MTQDMYNLLKQIDEETKPTSKKKLNEAKGGDPRKIAKKLFIQLMDSDIVEGGMENVEDNLDDVMVGSDPNTPESKSLRSEVKKAVMDYIKQTKAFIKTLK